MALKLRCWTQKKQVVGLLCKQYDFRPRCSEKKMEWALSAYPSPFAGWARACLLMARLEQHYAQHWSRSQCGIHSKATSSQRIWQQRRLGLQKAWVLYSLKRWWDVCWVTHNNHYNATLSPFWAYPCTLLCSDVHSLPSSVSAKTSKCLSF